MARRWENTNYKPSSAPKGYVAGLGDAVEILRRELGKVEYIRDRFGNPSPLPPGDALPGALAKVQAAGLMPAIKDYLSDYPSVDEEQALLTLIGDPTYSDMDEWGGPPSDIPMVGD